MVNRVEVWGDGAVMLEDCFYTQSEAVRWIEGYICWGDWGGYSRLSVLEDGETVHVVERETADEEG